MLLTVWSLWLLTRSTRLWIAPGPGGSAEPRAAKTWTWAHWEEFEAAKAGDVAASEPAAIAATVRTLVTSRADR
ncbi:hypothetical protein GCM10010350_77320 [Streptomyces galilaeus]|nr:hypothetical protein GCM10010350_77320 [Streptomyces galilaeus]